MKGCSIMEQFENNDMQNENINQQEESVVEEEQTSSGNKLVKEILDWIKYLIIAVIIALVIRTYIFTLVRVDGASMNPTLSHGDTLYANRFLYEPEVGDIIVFRPPHSPKTPYIKRIIATEGQVVDIDPFSRKVSVDGVVLEEEYIKEPMLSGGNMQYPCTVPEGHIFVMGDNRNNSLDSRTTTVGFVPVDNVIGEAVFRLLPLNGIGILR
jgi:signal peptidase I